jgi:hypothetical protein
MADEDEPLRAEAKSDADRTLLGVAPPRIDSSVDTVQRSPVFVRSGTSVSEIEPPPSHAAPLNAPPAATPRASERPVAMPLGPDKAADVREKIAGWLQSAQQRPVLSMAVAPVLVAVFAIWLGHHPARARRPVAPASSGVAAEHSAAPGSAKTEIPGSTSPAIADLEAKPPESLNARELLLVAEAQSERRRADARALRRKLEDNPALARDNSAVQAELLRLAKDDRTARDALAAMAVLEPPLGADLLYETWTRTPERSDATELARALVYSADVRPKASPALAVALELRIAETCEQYKAILPSALKAGDRRSLQLLSKLSAKRGCGPKKTADCFACLREPRDELAATISAVKSRHAPSYTAE